jgi:hypothetical protein
MDNIKNDVTDPLPRRRRMRHWKTSLGRQQRCHLSGRVLTSWVYCFVCNSQRDTAIRTSKQFYRPLLVSILHLGININGEVEFHST